ncbi:MAG: hypothetical protein ACXAC5_03230 [Promethearchaeota archaeon]|jgi:hypothetical protein
MMNFFSHKIANPAGNASTWNDWLENYFQKEASEAKPECDDDPRGQCRGQVINNDNEEGAHSYQEGESVDGKPDQEEGGSHKEAQASGEVKDTQSEETATSETTTKEAHCDKEMGECDKAGDVTEDHSDAGNADVGNAQVEQNINNDPNYQKGESTNPGKVDGKNKKTEASTKTAVKSGFKKIACLERKEKLELFAHMTSQKTKSGTAVYPIQYVEAMVGLTFANMKDDEKSWFRKFWLTMYPDSYVEEMVADR